MVGSSVGFGENVASQVYQKVSPSVATLSIKTVAGESFVAAGFVYGEPSQLLTAWHAVHDAALITATFPDGAVYKDLRVVAYESVADLALLQMTGAKREPVQTSLETPLVGEPVYTIGSPRGYHFTMSDGIISGVREIDGVQHVQVTCAFAPGNSGGPLINAKGEVIAVASWSNRNAQNLNFTVPVHYAAQLADSGRIVTTTAHFSSDRLEKMDVSMPTNENNDYDRYQNFLQDMQGRTVKIFVEAEGDSPGETFTFVVPK